MTNSTQSDHRFAPIRSYEEVAAIMRARGDTTMKANQVHWYERKAKAKLMILLAEYATYFLEDGTDSQKETGGGNRRKMRAATIAW